MQEELYKRLHAPELGPCVCSQVRRLARKLSFLYDTRLSPEDLTITQYSLLANIERAGPVKPPGPGQEDRNGKQHTDAQSTSPGEAQMGCARDRQGPTAS